MTQSFGKRVEIQSADQTEQASSFCMTSNRCAPSRWFKMGRYPTPTSFSLPKLFDSDPPTHQISAVRNKFGPGHRGRCRHLCGHIGFRLKLGCMDTGNYQGIYRLTVELLPHEFSRRCIEVDSEFASDQRQLLGLEVSRHALFRIQRYLCNL